VSQNAPSRVSVIVVIEVGRIGETGFGDEVERARRIRDARREPPPELAAQSTCEARHAFGDVSPLLILGHLPEIHVLKMPWQSVSYPRASQACMISGCISKVREIE